MIVLPVPSLLSPPVVTELQQADLITNADCSWLYDISDVVRAQKGKSPEVLAKTADVLRRHGFEKESRLFAGTQSSPSSVCLCFVVQWNLPMTATLCHPLLSTDSRCPLFDGSFPSQPEAVCSWLSIRYTVLERDNYNFICQIGYPFQVFIDSCMDNRRSSTRVRFLHRKWWKLLSTVKKWR